MNIHENTALLDAFLDGELTAEESAAVEAHLDVCQDCRAYVDDGLAIRAAFPTEEAAALPAKLHAHVMAAVANAPQSRPKKQPWGKLMAAAACLALIVAVQHGWLGMGAESSDTAAYSTADCTVAEDSVPMERSAEAPESALAEPEENGAAPKLESDSAPAVTDAPAAEDVKRDLPAVRVSEADMGNLLADLTPVETTSDCARYLLTRGEFEELAAALAERDISLEAPSGSEQLWLEVYSE